MPRLTTLCLLAAALAALARADTSAPADTGWVSLFDGKTLKGWKAAEHPESIRVVDGMIYGDGPRAHLFYLGDDGQAEFENFELELEVKAMPGANSGVYFHATWQDKDWPRLSGTEVQVNNDQPAFSNNYVENKKTGSLYGFRNLYKTMARDGEWFTLNIQVRKPRVQVRLNGRLMIDYVEPANVPVLAAGTTRDMLTKGTFALQCHDEKSQVCYRHIRVRRLAPGADAAVAKPVYNEQDRQRLVLARDNFPLLHLRTHLTDKLTLEQVQALRNRTGIFAGIAHYLNGDGPIRDEASALAAIAAMTDEPAFVGLEVSGPQGFPGLTQLAPETLAKFDFIVAAKHVDGMGGEFFDTTPEAVDRSQMESLVAGIVKLIETQPIDVYANVMVLPKGFSSSAEALWTEEHMQRVIAVAAKHGVAFEINPRRRTPSEKFIRLAKAAGVKFTIGSDETTAENYTDWPYLLEVQKKVGLVWRDMWVPGHGPTRAQRELAR